MLKLKRLHQESSSSISLDWDDGHSGPVSLADLRDHCPCANCKGESVLLRSYVPPAPDKTIPGRYVLKGVEPVGSYGLRFEWGDGHNEGIYTWQLLRSLCGCPSCSQREGTAQSG